MTRPVFYVSDGTGITAETIGSSLLTQFSGVPFETLRIAFVDNSKQTKEADRQLLKQVSYESIAPPTDERIECTTPAPFALDTDSASVSYWDRSDRLSTQ